MTSVLIERGNVDTETDTVRTSCEDEGREQADEVYRRGNRKDFQQTTNTGRKA